MFTMPITRGAIWDKLLAILLIVPIIIAGWSLQSWGARKTKQWAAYVADLQSRGEPLTLVEVNARRRAADAGNTAMQLLELLADELEALPEGELAKHVLVFSDDSPTLIEGIPGYFIQPTRDFLTQTSELYAHLVAMDEMPLGRFEISNASTALEASHLESLPILNASYLLKVSALAAIWDGDTPTAVEDVRRNFRLAAGLHDYPGRLAAIVETALCANGKVIIEYMMHCVALDDGALAALEVSVDEAVHRATLKWMLWGERAVFVDTVIEIGAGKFTKPNASSTAKPINPVIVAIIEGAPGKVFFQANQLRGARMFDRLIDRMNDLPNALAEAQILEQELEALPKTQALTKMLLGTLHRPILTHVRGLALMRCTQTAIAQERFRLHYGHWAQSLTDLIPEFLSAMPIDPFNRQPLLMVQSEEAMTIYSFNDDLTDDGGSVRSTPLPNGRGFENLDIGFRLLPPEKRGVVILDFPLPEDDDE